MKDLSECQFVLSIPAFSYKALPISAIDPDAPSQTDDEHGDGAVDSSPADVKFDDKQAVEVVVERNNYEIFESVAV